jgi:hypothetical protein
MKMHDPEKAKEMENFLFKKNAADEVFATELDVNEIKLYPGSPKGPEPEDDPVYYSKWFLEHQPKSLRNENGDIYEDLGMKVRYRT